MKKINHTHKLKKINYKSGNSVFFCVLDCGFKISVPLSLGKKSICWRCGEEFIMNEYSLRLTKPHCSSCHKSKSNKNEVSEEDKLFGAASGGGKLDELINSLSLTERLNSITKKEEEEEI